MMATRIERVIPLRRRCYEHSFRSAGKDEFLKLTKLVLAIAAAVAFAAPSRAQQRPADAATDSAIAYRVQVVIAEYDGATKISSLPYSVPVAVSGDPRAQGSLRVGIRVPINASTKSGESAVQYMDIGTNLDIRVKHVDTERYELELTIERSSLCSRREQRRKGRGTGLGAGRPRSRSRSRKSAASLQREAPPARRPARRDGFDHRSGHGPRVESGCAADGAQVAGFQKGKGRPNGRRRADLRPLRFFGAIPRQLLRKIPSCARMPGKSVDSRRTCSSIAGAGETVRRGWRRQLPAQRSPPRPDPSVRGGSK